MIKKATCNTTVKHTAFSWRWPLRLVGAAGVLSALGFAQAALALPPTYSVIEPEEFNLPIVKPGHGVNFAFQNFVYTNADKAYNSNGNEVGASQRTHNVLGVTRIGHLFSLSATPNVGYYIEYLQPEVSISPYGGARGANTSGLADPLFILSAFIKPAPNLVVGYDNGFTVPIGNSDLTFDYFSFQPNLYFDYHIKTPIGIFGADGLGGATIRTNSNSNGNEINNGNSYYVDLTLRYRPNKWVVPFFSYDYIHNDSSTYNAVGSASALKGISPGDTFTGSGYENIVGGGLNVYLNTSQTLYLSAAYKVGISGKNIGRTNGVFTVLKYVF